MTHSVEGWAVQYRRNRKGARWQWWTESLKVVVFNSESAAASYTERLRTIYEDQTRIVRVRQTTEVIDE
jgi:hypothetical protein